MCTPSTPNCRRSSTPNVRARLQSKLQRVPYICKLKSSLTITYAQHEVLPAGLPACACAWKKLHDMHPMMSEQSCVPMRARPCNSRRTCSLALHLVGVPNSRMDCGVFFQIATGGVGTRPDDSAGRVPLDACRVTGSISNVGGYSLGHLKTCSHSSQLVVISTARSASSSSKYPTASSSVWLQSAACVSAFARVQQFRVNRTSWSLAFTVALVRRACRLPSVLSRGAHRVP